MKHFAISFWLWFPAVLRACLQALAAMIAAFLGNISAHTPETRIQWAILFGTVLVAGITVVTAFLDQTMALIKSKAGGETALFYRDDSPPPVT